MVITLGLLILALGLYVSERIPVEVASIGLLVVMMVAFHLLPVQGPDGRNLLSPEILLSGFGNPALLTVMALLVVAEGLNRTGTLDRLVDGVGNLRLSPSVLAALALAVVCVTSAFINDTPVVVMFLPVFQALAMRAGHGSSRLMMPLSFAAILGGMTTLIGSSTNLLVSSALISQGLPGLEFFQQTPMGVWVAAVGFIYVVFVMPRLLPKGESGGLGGGGGGGKQFVSQCVVAAGSALDGAQAAAGRFRQLPDITVHLIVRDGESVFPPYDDVVLTAGDVLMIAGSRKALTETAARYPGLLSVPEIHDDDDDEAPVPRPAVPTVEQVMVEAMVPPTSRFTGFSVEQLGLNRYHNLVVLGLERRARMMRGPTAGLRLQAGDVLLLMGRDNDIETLRRDRDLVVISGSAGLLPRVHHAKTAGLLFLAMLGLSATGVLPIAIAAIGVAVLLVALGALTARQAIGAIDAKIVLLVGNALALGQAMEATGAAAFLAKALLLIMGDVGPWVAVVAFFGLVSLITNVLSNNATAVLFTPIAVGLARQLGVDPHLFAITVIIAANCSFITPIGYQTNLLVMGPGHYRFIDYAKAGLPLTLLLWATFAIGAKVVWGL
ncbi:SLC13 family permease [Magnetospirillum sp. J10]|uniref:SLC13 family permease n=2 Tax=Magnetospirillum sulfuroxidans TaxID=611300 RepID=A0ABS5IDB0_9PROT|nr:SLC13 family permease [Magnetospirillum sulfuroxidans]MBR9972162.1 SLC13 family permease [Magnetospirillum sulfuroxidans]